MSKAIQTLRSKDISDFVVFFVLLLSSLLVVVYEALNYMDTKLEELDYKIKYHTH